MIYHTSQGSKFYGDKEVKYKELEIKYDDTVRFTFRRYPSNTFITYHNDYKGYAKVLYKLPHKFVDEGIAKYLAEMISAYQLIVGGNEFDSIVDMYNKMKVEKMK